MATALKGKTRLIFAGIGSGLVISAAVRLMAGLFFTIPDNLTFLLLFGIAGAVGGTCLGLILVRFNYDAFFRHLDKTKDLT